ncbi:MAG: hypothetical protein A2W93_08805 [Bacteroidetes bacterium GWF2_43_63]|nr:MAG: hypothetical protein A2W94_02990 [Bacteroidetes bacterium GWE2_42_42]OFY55228.1 MAG: hypothetical protein A2W93_08805 [Bacteroidetes bacterium GWF2_43_63]HBG70893.1 hypothetical protein [Bacteroidales bacterium]HCB63343.1 hypothetical protein [Bacteroidales bacterium]HCY23046.1 hypothetical protein [Bacteroidales bacterium]
MKKLLISVMMLVTAHFAFADEYYWVGGSGYWSDTSHWAVSSGGSVYHSTIPGSDDTVYFDASSFNANGKIITVDTSMAFCAMMDWSGIVYNVEFNSTTTDTLNVYGHIYLSDKVTFNYNGLIRIYGLSGAATYFETQDKTLKCDLQMAADTLYLQGKLQLPYNRLLHTDGVFYSNGHRIACRHFNTDHTFMASVPVVNPKWFSADSLTVSGSFALPDPTIFAHTGPLFFQNSTIDTNYINTYANEMACDVYMNGSKKMYLLSQFKTGGILEFRGGGQFYSQGWPIFVGAMRNTTALTKTISLGNSAVQISGSGNALYLNDVRLNLDAAQAFIKFTYAGSDTVNISLGKDSLFAIGEVELPTAFSRIFSSFVTGNIIIKPASKVQLAHGIELTVDTMNAAGSCGQYIYLSSFCADNPFITEMNACNAAIPKINAVSGDITVSYLKISYNNLSGDIIHALNSFEFDGVSGWDVVEPANTETLYWIGGTGNWNDATHWATTSGGSSGGCIPVRGNDVVFDLNSFSSEDTVTINEQAYCNQMLWTNIDELAHLSGKGTLFISSSMLLHDSLTIDVESGIEFTSSLAPAKDITSRNAEIYSEITFNTSRTYNFTDTLHSFSNVILQKGNLNLNKKGLICRSLDLSGNLSRSLDYSKSIINLTAADTVWNSSGSGLTLAHDSGAVILSNSNTEMVVMKAAGITFDTLKVNSPRTRILGGGSSDLLYVSGGTALEFEPATTWSLDSLLASGSCTQPVSLSAFIGESGTASISKTGYDTLNISDVVIQNLVADSAGGREYNAIASTGIGITTGWIFSGAVAGKTYYWTGLADKNWHNANNWTPDLILPFSAATCVPGPADTVVFTDLHFSTATSDTVDIYKNAYCKVMDWSSILLTSPSLLIEANLQISDDVLLNENLNFGYGDLFSASDANTPALILAPLYGHAEFDPLCSRYGVNTLLAGFSTADTLFLIDSLVTDSTVSFTVNSGTFVSNEWSMRVGLLKTETSSAKQMLLKNSDISIKYSAVFQDPSILTLDADSTSILMPGNKSFRNYFDGGNQRFFDLEMLTLFSDSSTAVYSGEVYGADTFRIFKVHPGIHLYFEANHEQTFDSAFVANGTCQDSIYIASTEKYLAATLTSLASDSIRIQCSVVRDITATNGAVAVFSRNVSNNTNWHFDAVPATTASFIVSGVTCFGDSVHFVNTSSAYSGNQGDLTFEWYMVDTSLTTTQVSPAYLFDNNQKYDVTLVSTFTNGCSDSYTDSVTIYKPVVNLNSSDADTTICSGDLVTFTANSPNPTPDFYFFSNGIPIIQSADSVKYRTDSIADGETIFAVVDYMGCLDTSTVFTFEVHSLPVVTLASSDLDNLICLGDSVTLTSAGADQYRLYLNGAPYNNLGTTNSWTFSNIADADEFTVFGRNITTGCEAFSSTALDFTVFPLPMVGLTSSEADTTICAGDEVTIHASGAAEYIFYLNGSPLGPQSTVDSVVISTLADNDIVSVEGISLSACRNFASGTLLFHVEVTPLLSFISDDADSRICAGDVITFQAGGATEYQFYINGVPTGVFNTNNSMNSVFSNGQTVEVQGKLGNCYAYADSVFTIDVRPKITWTFSDSVICAYETIDLEADGDSVYQYFINGIAVTPLQYDSIYHASGLIDGQFISVSGTQYACTPLPLEVTVYSVPVVEVTCSELDTAICQGQNILFTASGSDTYGFYVNGTAPGPYSTVSVFSTTALNNGDTISVQAVSGDGCHSFAADTFIVEVAPNPVVSVLQSDPDLTICAGDTVSFSASGASSYEFFVTGASQGAPSAVSSLSLNNLVNGAVVTVQGTTGYCTTVSSNVYQYIVNAIPNVTLNPVSGISVCTGDTIQLLAGGATSYQFFVDGLPWGVASGNSLFSCDTLVSGNVVYVEGTLVGCTGNSGSTYAVTVNEFPILSFINDIPTGNICYGDTVTFEGNGAQNYNFYLEGNPVSADSLFVTADLQNGQEVTLFGYNGVCGLWADTIMTIGVNYVNVSLTSDLPSTAVCEGSPVQFTAIGADLYEFFIDGVSQGSPSATNVFIGSSLSNGQLVSVNGTSNSSGCTQTAYNDIYVHTITVPVIVASPDDVFCEGDSVLLSSSVGENNHWYFEGIPVAGVTDSSIWAYEGGNYYSVVSAGSIGNVWSCGENSLGQFGNGTTINNLYFQPSVLTTHAMEVACGAEFTMVLNDDGTVKAWGRNEFGALGTGNFSDSNIPVNVGSLTAIQKIAAGNRFGLALKSDGTLVSWGDNTFGQLGYGNYSTSNFPFAVLNIDSVTGVATGENHVLAITSDGHVWAWGRNQAGQLGDSTQTNRNIPVQVKHLDNVVAVAAGANHSMALKSDGTLWVWGSNANGQLGLGNITAAWTPEKVNLYNSVVSFDGGSAHSLACDTMGIVYAWGDNTFGQLGLTSVTGSYFPLVSDVSGGVTSVKAGNFTSYALRVDSNLVSWGQNQLGQLGHSGTTNVFVPQIIEQVFEIGSFDAGEKHLAVIPVYEQSCTPSGITITMDTVPEIDLVVNGLVLSTTTAGVSYQWYYNGSAIPGATGTTVTIAALGTYYIVVTFANGCSGFSDEFQYGVGMDEYGVSQMLLYPNPSIGEFTVMLSESDNAKSWRIINSLGQIIESKSDFSSASVFEVRGLSLAAGVYSIQVICSDGAVRSAKFTVTE